MRGVARDLGTPPPCPYAVVARRHGRCRPRPRPYHRGAPPPISVDPADILAGRRRAIARALTAVENALPGADALVDALYPHTGRAWRVGITGPPGAGKSTLTDRLVGLLRARGETVAVVAVDPSSPFTGGALLGDRVRMDARMTGPGGQPDDGVFVRSLAARGALGGLSEAAEAACDVFDAAGFDVILVETVGVGQGEIDVAETADTCLVVLVPESGDAVQAMKAGLMEVATVFAVNKADHAEAPRLVRALRQALHLRPPARDGWAPPVVAVSALKDDNVDGVLAALDGHRAHLAPAWAAGRDARLRRRVRRLVEAAWRAQFWAGGRSEALAAAVAGLDAGARAPHRLAADVLAAPAAP